MNIDGISWYDFGGDEGVDGDNIIISAPYAGLGLENYGKVYVIGGEKRNGGKSSAVKKS